MTYVVTDNCIHIIMNEAFFSFFIMLVTCEGLHNWIIYAYTTTRTVELGPLRIGSAACCGRYFDGRMDDLRIYNAVVSDTHIGYLSGL